MSSNNNSNKAGMGRGPMGGKGHFVATTKSKDFKGTIKRLFKYMAPYKYRLIVIVCMAVLGALFSVLTPKVLGLGITKIADGMIAKFRGVAGASIDFTYLTKIVIFLVLLYIFSAFFTYLQQFLMAGVAQNTIYKIRKEVDYKLNKLPLKYFDSNSKGDILSRVTNDLDNVSSTLQQSLNELITSVVTIIGVTIMMLTINVWLTLICLVVLPVGVFCTRPIIKKSQKFFGSQQKELGLSLIHI